MIDQLDIFSIAPDCSSRELPKYEVLLEPKIEEALNLLKEVAKLAIKDELVEGCIVRSDLFFKGKTAKVISLKQIHTITLATVEIEFKGELIRFPCGTCGLEVVK